MEIADAEFQTRLGHPRAQLANILQQISEAFASADAGCDITQAWSDGGSVQVRAISVFGDPVDMGTDQALSFAELISRCAREADGAWKFKGVSNRL